MTARLRALRLLPVIVIDDAEAAAPLAHALTDGGLPAAEVTFRTAAAAEAIRRMADASPDLLVGAGTVLTTKQADDALAAGARFIVAPGFNRAVVEHCLARGVPVYPGVCTPTEVEAALATGVQVLKFFPAEPMGGVKFLKAIAAPYGMVEWMPTGGVTVDNVQGYLDFKKVVACGGSWMAPQDAIASGDFERIRAETARAVRSVREPAAGGG